MPRSPTSCFVFRNFLLNCRERVHRCFCWRHVENDIGKILNGSFEKSMRHLVRLDAESALLPMVQMLRTRHCSRSTGQNLRRLASERKFVSMESMALTTFRKGWFGRTPPNSRFRSVKSPSETIEAANESVQVILQVWDVETFCGSG